MFEPFQSGKEYRYNRFVHYLAKTDPPEDLRALPGAFVCNPGKLSVRADILQTASISLKQMRRRKSGRHHLRPPGESGDG